MRRLLLLVGVAVALGGGVAATKAVAASGAPAVPSLESLTYSIRTTYATGNGACGGERITPATIGLPQLVNAGGDLLPEAIVVLVAAPATDATPALLQLLVTPLRDYKGVVEAVVAPSAGAAGRFAVGYDGCEAGNPASFAATLTAAPTRVSVNATTVTTHPSLKVLGSFFNQVGTTRTDPTAVVARLAPVPLNISTVVDIAGSTYHAMVESSQPTRLGLTYTDVKGAARTNATIDVNQLPQSLVVDFDTERAAYVASCSLPAAQLRARVDLSQSPPSIDVTFTRYGDGTPCRIAALDFGVTTEKPFARSSRLEGQLRGLPAVAELKRTTPTRATFVAPDTIESATVGFASYQPGGAPPVLTPQPDQYLVARVNPLSSAAQVRLLALARADVDAGDPAVVDITHAAGPFHVAAQLASLEATRNLNVDVLNLPATAKLTYSPTTQVFTYDGSDVIHDLTATVTSDVPLVDDAHLARLHIVDLPTGLTGRFDNVEKTFTASLRNGAIAILELEVTSGPDLRPLLDGEQGVAVQDANGSYAAFVRVTGVTEAAVSWGKTQSAHVVHTPGPFLFRVDVDDTSQDAVSDDDISFHGDVRSLPVSATLSYDPANEHVGNNSSVLTYDGSDIIRELSLDVVGELDRDPLSRHPNEAHVVAGYVPRHLKLVVNNVAKTMVATTKLDDGTAGDPLGALTLELCTTNGCRPLPAPGHDRLDVLDHLINGEAGQYRAFTRLSGFREVSASWDDTASVTFDKAPGPLDVVVDKDIIQSWDRPEGGFHPAPVPPCGFQMHPAWCEDEESPANTVYYGFPTHLDVAIDQLPATGSLSYEPKTHHVVYHGDAVIRSIVANFTSQFKRFPPRVRFAHVELTDMPTDLNLTLATASEGKHITADTGGQPLGHLDFWMTNSGGAPPDLPFDGLAVHNGCPETRGCVDADEFALRGRVTGLTHLDYTETEHGLDDTERTVDLQRAPKADGRGETVWLLVSKLDTSKHDDLAQFSVIYADPPSSFTVVARDREKQTDVAYWGPRGGSLVFETNAGANRSFLNANITPVPAATLTDPGLNVCLAPSYAVCSPLDKTGGHDEMSFSVKVTEPITLNIVDCVEVNGYLRCQDEPPPGLDYRNTLLRIDNLQITRSLTVMKEKVNVEWDFDNANVHVDTGGAPVEGEVTSTKFLYATGAALPGSFPDQWVTQTKLHVALLKGFFATNRYGEIDCTPGSGCSWGDNATPGGINRTTCPAGTKIEVKVAPLYLSNFEDEFCPPPVVDSVELSSGGPAAVAQGTTANVRLRGDLFSPSVCSGTWQIDWPTCAGPDVQVRLPNTVGPDPNIHVTNVLWHSLNEVTFDVTVDCAADTAPRRNVRVENPVEGHNETTASAAFEVLPGTC